RFRLRWARHNLLRGARHNLLRRARHNLLRRARHNLLRRARHNLPRRARHNPSPRWWLRCTMLLSLWTPRRKRSPANGSASG
ncbi:MAG: hypothetical protein Q8O40_00290, partial [Chloroflexota bacterium]|nr:hypothetical protein [Chloroflexota bacterium]